MTIQLFMFNSSARVSKACKYVLKYKYVVVLSTSTLQLLSDFENIGMSTEILKCFNFTRSTMR